MMPHGVSQFLRFGAIGVVGTLAQYVVLWLGVAFLGWAAVWASATGYVLGSVVNYVLNYRLTFASRRSHLGAASRFYLVVGIGWCINTSLMGFLAGSLNWDIWLAQVLTTGIGLGWNFTGSKLWVFGDECASNALTTTASDRAHAYQDWD